MFLYKFTIIKSKVMREKQKIIAVTGSENTAKNTDRKNIQPPHKGSEQYIHLFSIKLVAFSFVVFFFFLSIYPLSLFYVTVLQKKL